MRTINHYVELAKIWHLSIFENELAKMTGIWDGQRRSNLALEDAFGRLPQSRTESHERLV